MTTLPPGLRTGSRLAALLLALSLGLGACMPAYSPWLGLGSLQPADGVLGSYASLPLPTASAPIPLTPTAALRANQRRLTEPGCCALPWWSADSSRVLFLDLRERDTLARVYAVPVGGGPTVRQADRPMVFSQDGSLATYPEGNRTVVLRLSDGKQWVIPSNGRAVRFSPSGKAIAWQQSSRGIAHPDLRETAVWIAAPDGTHARRIVTTVGGGLVGWTTGESAILITGSPVGKSQKGVWRVELDGGQMALLRGAASPHDPLLSPAGGWVAYYVAFDVEPGANGLWLLKTDGSLALKVTPFAAYRWRAEGRLLLIPYGQSDEQTTLWEVNAESGNASRLADPATSRLPIAANDWQPSPDGSHLVYRSAEDGSLWVLDLGPE